MKFLVTANVLPIKTKTTMTIVGHTFFRDTLIVGIVNAGTSIFAGFVIFSFLGYLSYELEESIEKVAQSGKHMYSLGIIFV